MNNSKSDSERRTHDLSFVPAHKREAVRRKIAALEAFMEVGGRPAAKVAAAELGMKTAQFYLLVRAWRNGCQLEELPGFGKPPAPRRRISDDQFAIIQQAVDLLPNASVEQIGEHAIVLARKRGVTMPSWAAIRTNIGKALVGRVPRRSAAIGADVIVEHCAVNVGVEGHDGRGYMPIATIVTDVAARRVLGVALSAEWPTARGAANALAAAAASLPPIETHGRKPLVFIETFPGQDWDRIVQSLLEAGYEVTTRARERAPTPDATHAVLGRRVQSISLHPHVSSRPSIARPARMQRGAAPISLAEAETYVQARLMKELPPTPAHGAANDLIATLVAKLNDISARKDD